jgi:hypothetical protein
MPHAESLRLHLHFPHLFYTSVVPFTLSKPCGIFPAACDFEQLKMVLKEDDVQGSRNSEAVVQNFYACLSPDHIAVNIMIAPKDYFRSPVDETSADRSDLYDEEHRSLNVSQTFPACISLMVGTPLNPLRHHNVPDSPHESAHSSYPCQSIS